MKEPLIKIFTTKDVFLGTLLSATVRPFEYRIDEGPGECVIDLAGKFDQASALIQLNNNFEIHVNDADYASGPSKLIYAGYLSLIEREIGPGKEGITLHLLGHQTKLAMDVYRSGTTTSMNFASAYLGSVVKDVIDKYVANTTNPKIHYDADAGVSPSLEPHITYLFEEKTYKEALDVCRGYASGGQYYRFDPNGKFSFLAPSTTPKHVLTFGRHFTGIKVAQSMEKVRSQVLFYNGVPSGGTKVYKKYTDAGATVKYGARVERHYDYGTTATATADEFSSRFLADAKGQGQTLSVRIMDSGALSSHVSAIVGTRSVGYDIESFRPGDTCRFKGFDETTAEFLGQNMLITKVTYGFDWADLTIEVLTTGFSPWQKRTTVELSKLSTTGMPTAYTT